MYFIYICSAAASVLRSIYHTAIVLPVQSRSKRLAEPGASCCIGHLGAAQNSSGDFVFRLLGFMLGFAFRSDGESGDGAGHLSNDMAEMNRGLHA
jgi:hypothetical protein